MNWTSIASPVPQCEAWVESKHRLTVIVGKEPLGPRGEPMWHLSIAHPRRYPSWDEITEARYRFVPDGAMMAMFLPPRGEYVNAHRNCFHLYEIAP